jgi:hypothetical protein
MGINRRDEKILTPLHGKEQGLVRGCCEYGDRPSSFRKVAPSVGQVGDHQQLQKNTVPLDCVNFLGFINWNNRL